MRSREDAPDAAALARKLELAMKAIKRDARRLAAGTG
jgi:hypothetical protein